MRSRRSVLAGLGALGGAGLAGCSALPVGPSEDERADVSLPTDVVESLSWPPSPFPAAVPESLATGHEERTTELLAGVPEDPSVPNGAVAEEIRADRERAAARLDDAIDEPWPTGRLSAWRSRRAAAATVRGAYRAATGEDDAGTVDVNRQAIRDALASSEAGHVYHASSPVEAVLVHAPVENLFAECRRRVRPDPTYPGDQVAAPFQAGEVVGEVERADATLTDARGLLDAYLEGRDDTAPQWSSLIETANRLRFAVGRSRSTVDGFLDVDEPPFDGDFEGTPARTLFYEASRQVSATADGFDRHRDDGDCATAVVEAGRALAAVETLETAVEGIRDGAYRDSATVESVTRTAERAREAITAIDEHENRQLATQIARPALATFEYIPNRIERGYADAPRVQGDLARVELYARVVPAATDFVAERLEDSG